jgi:hypothetical protein
MYVYSMLDGGTNAKLEQRLGVAVKPKKEGTPSASIIVRKNSSGGVDSPVAYIMDPGKTIVIAGQSNDAGMDFAEAAADQGVPEDNIYFAPISLKDLVVKIRDIMPAGGSQEEPLTTQEQKAEPEVESEPVTEQEQEPFTEPKQSFKETPVIKGEAGEPDGEIGWAASLKNRVKTVAVVGFRGGVGKSTVAASLADHYRGNGEVVAIVDLGSPPTTYRHFGFTELIGEARDGFIVLKGRVDIFVPEVPVYDLPGEILVKVVNELKKEYRRVIIDYPSEPRQSHLDVSIDCPVIVVDHDMVLSVKDGVDGVYVYNKAVPEVPKDVVADFLHGDPVVIKMDIEDCIAALVAGETAYQSSGIVAEGIGNLAARIG